MSVGRKIINNIRGKTLKIFSYPYVVIHPLSIQYFSREFNFDIHIFISQLLEMVFASELNKDLKNFFS